MGCLKRIKVVIQMQKPIIIVESRNMDQERKRIQQIHTE